MRETVLGLKIDVDTYEGMKEGVPRLLSTLSRFHIKGTFYLSFGPDASGLAVLQLIKNPRFLTKMFRTNAAQLYGFKTALYGTLLPSPMIALSFPGIVEQIMAEGHEVEFHAWDHRRWQDGLADRSTEWIRNWFDKGVGAYRTMTKKNPLSFGAPAWLIDDRVMEIVREYPFEYLSCTRAKKPFIHERAGLMEIPADLPCFEEMGIERSITHILSTLAREGGIHVLTAHAEVEGGIWSRSFVELLEKIIERGCHVLPLSEIKGLLSSEELPVRMHRMELLAGRAAPCAV